MADRLTYVYAIGDAALARSPLPDLSGVDDTPVRTLVHQDLTAVVSSVDAARFNAEALRAAFEDLSWLEATARAHNGVVDVLARSHPVAPLRLATVYLDDANVVALLAERAGGFTAVLDRIRGRTEWGVKAFAVHPVVAPATSAREGADPEDADPGGGDPGGGGRGSAGPGTSYLMRRRAERDRAEQGEAQAHDAAERLHQRLSEIAVATRRYPPQDARLTGYQEEMVLNAAYLVDEPSAAELRRMIDDRDSGVLRLELTGPWAPYSFATLAEEP